MSRLSARLFAGRAKKARTSLRLSTTPGEPRSIRKFEIVSNAAAGALRESCNHEPGTIFLCHIEGAGSNVGDKGPPGPLGSPSRRLELARDLTRSPKAIGVAREAASSAQSNGPVGSLNRLRSMLWACSATPLAHESRLEQTGGGLRARCIRRAVSSVCNRQAYHRCIASRPKGASGLRASLRSEGSLRSEALPPRSRAYA